MPRPDLFADVMLALDTASDAIRAMRGALSRGDTRYLQGSSLLAVPTTEAIGKIAAASHTIRDAAIIALWARFERYIVEYASASAVPATAHPINGFAANVAAHLTRELEYSRFNDLLDLFKPGIDPRLIGIAKQIKQDRDWIVHRNPAKPTPAKTDPATARALLSRVVDEIRLLDPSAP